MLVLGRRPGESINIGHDIEVKVHSIDLTRRQVKIAVDAPEDVEIHRKEIYRKIFRGTQDESKDCDMQQRSEDCTNV